MINSLVKYKVIDLLDLIEEIGGKNYQSHPVYKEWEYILVDGERTNQSISYSTIGEDAGIPLIDEFLLENEFEKGETVMFYISW